MIEGPKTSTIEKTIEKYIKKLSKDSNVTCRTFKKKLKC